MSTETSHTGGLSAPFIRRPIATLMLMIGVVLIGIIAYGTLPVAALPSVDLPTIQVTAQLPGADPETMASSVATPLERQFGQIPGLSQMTSASATGFAQVTLQFDASRTVDSAAGDVQAAINAAGGDLPKTMPTPPTYRKTNPADTPILILALTSDTLPLTTVDDYAESILAQKLSQVPGVGLVTIGGQQQPAMRVEINPQQLAAQGLALEDVRTALAAVTVDNPKGTLEGKQQAYALQTNDQLTKITDFNNVIVAYKNGAPIRVKDIGHAEIGPANDELAAWYGHGRGIILAVQRLPGANVIQTVDRINQELPQLEASLPPAIKISLVSDRTTTIRASVADVQFTLALTIGLVVMTILVFLRNLWATIIPGIAVPLSIVGTFAVMAVLGYSLDNLSLMALSIAVGFVVDDAIVMVENIVHHLEHGKKPLEAALAGAGEIGFTILSISVSLVAVFIPLLLMNGVVGKLFQEFAVTVAVAIGVSAFVSLTLTPMLCAYLLKPVPAGGARHGLAYRLLERGFDRLAAGYDAALTRALRHQRTMLVVMLATVTLTGYLFVSIPKGFFPQQDTGLIAGVTEAAQDVSSEALATKQQQVVDLVLKDPAVASVASYVGPGGTNPSPNQGRLFIALKPRGQRGPHASADEVIRRLSRQLEGVTGIHLYMQASQDITIGGRVAKTQYQYTLTDVNAGELASWAPKVVAAVAKLKSVAAVTSDQQSAGLQFSIAIDRDAASRLGIQPQDIDNALDDAFGQRVVTKVFTSLNQYYVILEVDPAFRHGPDALTSIYLRSSAGAPVPLDQVAHPTATTAPLLVNHQGQFPSVTVSFNLAPGSSIGTAVTDVQQTVAALHLPRSIQASFQGTAHAYETALAGQPALIAAALAAVYLILGMLYESAIHPVTILSTLPSAGLGALLTLMAAGMPLDVIGIIGIVLLIGIVKKNGIMMVDFALAAEREGKTPLEAVHAACLSRFRPILMTTMCAILGGIPLMVGTGTGSEIRQPLGYAMVGGLAVSQVLTLFTTPVVYLYMGRLEQAVGRLRALLRQLVRRRPSAA
ncbi:acriflavine resistance protein B [Aliidongia dinghuensis]|uniref:Acriflavine resistance protein B n=1 Tax=Aliidongia dinghuensis TaxID=1867774 RepID=A0A8J2YSC6_9PROT|nr:efflux RND transporter permease subunit [Aliidongia dinghuensis]GGF09696.1 acriflavine resistance protein B [Aliidongia dinghuensis]